MKVRTASALAVLAGFLLACQARVNGTLTEHTHGAVSTAAISFSVGTAVLVVLVAANGSAPRAWSRREGLAWWACLGGLGGAFLVSVSAYAVPVLGVALLTVATTAGQTAGGLGVDRVGLAPGGRRPTTVWRGGGALLAIGAVGLAAVGTHVDDAWIFPLVAVSGVAVAVQQALNGRLRAHTGEATFAALVSFAGGTVALLVAATVAGWPTSGYPGWGQVYLYLGGVFGAFYITLSAMTVHVLGVLRLSLASLAGQLAGGVALDVATPGKGLHPLTVVAVVLTLVAVALAGRTTRRPAEPPVVVPAAPVGS